MLLEILLKTNSARMEMKFYKTVFYQKHSTNILSNQETLDKCSSDKCNLSVTEFIHNGVLRSSLKRKKNVGNIVIKESTGALFCRSKAILLLQNCTKIDGKFFKINKQL